MTLKIEQVPFKGWPNVLRVGNGDVELLATLDVGPRILSYSRPGGLNPFNIYEDQAGGRGEAQWRNRGGHRLWLAPEGPDFSYFPDNHPVAFERLGERGVRLAPPPETTGFRKQIDLTFEPSGTGVTVTHRIERIARTPGRAALWALSVMAAGGCAIMPQPPLGQHPRDLLPNRRMVVWPYTVLSDPRYRFGRSFFTLRQEPGGVPTKIGLALKEGWAGYLLGRTLFIKRFAWEAGKEYPDDGCNFEVFTNHRMLELESLGPLNELAAGQAAELVEKWELHELPAGDWSSEEQLERLPACIEPVFC